MKTYQKNITLFVILSLCLFVYFSKKEKEVVVPSTVATTTDIFINDVNEFYTISAQYPKELWDKDFTMEKDVLTIVNQKKEEWKIGGPVNNEEKAITMQYPDRPILKYELNIKFDKFESKDKGTVSYVFKNYEFTGGAHGGTGLVTYTFDKNGIVNIGDILDLTSSGHSLAISKIMRDKLKVSLGELHNAEMLDGGLGLQFINANGNSNAITGDAFNFSANFNNFVVLDEGIRFIFGQYQVAPYAAGIPEVLLTWEELSPYLKKYAR